LPVEEASWVALLARAVPGMSRREMMWEISEADGNALIHAGSLIAGEAMVWPDLRLSERGRWWMGVEERWRGRCGG
jgi:hypothetical protein